MSSPKEKRKYTQKFREEWLHNKALKPWLLQLSYSNNSKAFCKICNCEVLAKFSCLMRHSKSNKHIRACKTKNKILNSFAESSYNDANKIEGTITPQGAVSYLQMQDVTFGEAVQDHHPPSMPEIGGEDIYLQECAPNVIQTSTHFAPAGVAAKPTPTQNQRHPETKKFIHVMKNKGGPANFSAQPRQPSVHLEDGDEFHFFALNVAAQLRKLPMERALKAQVRVQGLLVQERIAAQYQEPPDEVSETHIQDNSESPAVETVHVSDCQIHL